MSKPKKKNEFAVLGLGHFGMRLAEVLAEEYDANVLACDSDAQKVQHASSFVAQAIQMDAADEDEIERLGLGNFDVVVVATGDDFEAAITATTVAKEEGSPYVIVKAESRRQKYILEKMGADRVVFPEREMGEKVARSLMNVDIMDIFREADNMDISEMPPLSDWVGKTIAESNIRSTHHLVILAIKRGYGVVAPVRPDEVLRQEDVLIVLKET